MNPTSEASLTGLELDCAAGAAVAWKARSIPSALRCAAATGLLVHRYLNDRFGPKARLHGFGADACAAVAFRVVFDDPEAPAAREARGLAIKKLRNALLAEAGAMAAEILPLNLTEAEAEAARADEIFAVRLAALGGEDEAAVARGRAQARRVELQQKRLRDPAPGTGPISALPGCLWSLWYQLPDWTSGSPYRPARWLLPIARLLWDLQIKPGLRRSAAAIPVPEHREILRRFRRARVEDDRGQLSLRYSPYEQSCVAVPAGMDADSIRQASRVLNSANGNRAIKWLIRDSWIAQQLGETGVGRYVFDGGTAFAARVLGGSPEQYRGKRAQEFTDIARMLLVAFDDPARGSRWSLASGLVTHGRGRVPGRISLAMANELLPSGVVFQRRGEHRRLVPITAEPPLVGRNNEHGPLLWFWERLVVAITLQARDVASGRGAVLPTGQLQIEAEASSLPWRTAQSALDLWTQEHGGVLRLVAPHRYVLTCENPQNEAAHLFVRDHGKTQERGSRGVPPRRKRR